MFKKWNLSQNFKKSIMSTEVELPELVCFHVTKNYKLKKVFKMKEKKTNLPNSKYLMTSDLPASIKRILK